MRRLLVLPLVLGLAGLLFAQRHAKALETPAGLAGGLRHLRDTLNEQNAAAVSSSLPPLWVIDLEGRRYSVSSGPLRDLLEGRVPKTNALRPNVVKAKAWLTQIAAHLEGSTVPLKGTSEASKKLKKVLAAPEFSSAEQESAWERFKRRAFLWIVSVLEKVFQAAFSQPGTGPILFWGLLFGAVGGIAYLLIRLFRRMSGISALPVPEQFEERTSEEWLKALRLAADAGDLGRAIQCAYWAGVSHLQEISVLPRDKTRTPREYLRSLTSSQSGHIPGSTTVDSLRSLTAQMERFWYAGFAPGQEDLAVCMTSLEALGCRAG